MVARGEARLFERNPWNMTRKCLSRGAAKESVAAPRLIREMCSGVANQGFRSLRELHPWLPSDAAPRRSLIRSVFRTNRSRYSHVVGFIRLSLVDSPCGDVDLISLLSRCKKHTGKMNSLISCKLHLNRLQISNGLSAVLVILNWVNTETSHVWVDGNARRRLPLLGCSRHNFPPRP